MMYLVTPTQLLWTDLLGVKPVDVVRAGGNFSAIEWQPTGRAVKHSDVAVALRYGIPVVGGIVVEAIRNITQDRPAELRRLHANVKRSLAHPTIQATDEFIDRYMAPGWKQHGEELAARHDESSEQSAREADDEAREELAEPMKEELVTHWRSIGGRDVDEQ